MTLTVHEPSPQIVTCSQCSKTHELAIFSTIPQQLFWCSHDCLKLYHNDHPSIYLRRVTDGNHQ